MKLAIRSLLVSLVIMSLATSLGAQTEPEFKSQKAGQTNQYELKWRVVGTELELIISAPTTGWIGVGFNPTLKMLGAGIIIGYVKDGKVTLSDDVGVAPGAHRPDTTVGGTSDLRLIDGTEASGRTQLHFAIPLNSKDKNDKVLKSGDEVTVIWAYGPNGADNFVTPHTTMGKFKITL